MMKNTITFFLMIRKIVYKNRLLDFLLVSDKWYEFIASMFKLYVKYVHVFLNIFVPHFVTLVLIAIYVCILTFCLVEEPSFTFQMIFEYNRMDQEDAE